MPRIHFWIVISLFVFLLLVSLIPTDVNTDTKIQRELSLPIKNTLEKQYAIAEPSKRQHHINENVNNIEFILLISRVIEKWISLFLMVIR